MKSPINSFLDWLDRLRHGTPWQIATVNVATGARRYYSPRQYPYGAGTLPNGGVWLNFPQHASEAAARSGDHVTRLWKMYSKPRNIILSTNLSLDMACHRDLFAQFFWKTEPGNTDDTPPTARPVLFNSSLAAFQATDEWWPQNKKYDLAASSVEQLTIPLLCATWVDEEGVSGSSSAALIAAFWEMLRNLEAVGLSFGGGFFAGHGVSTIGGNARFELRSMSPNPR